MESSKPELQRQAHRNVYSWDVHPRHALETSLYFVGDKTTHTFEELTTCVHDMELSIVNKEARDFLIPKMKSDKNQIDDAKK